jgi:hypothetical protein
MNSLKVITIILVATCWFPHSLERTTELGYDFPIYYRQALGMEDEGWLYAEYIVWVFRPLTLLDHGNAFLLFYALTVLAWVRVTARIDSWFLWAASFYPMLLILELGNVAGILAYLVLTPLGSLLAGLCKPYLLVFSAFHAIRFYLGKAEHQALAQKVKCHLRLFGYRFV